MKKLFTLTFLSLLSSVTFGQEKLPLDYILFEGKDTLFCVINTVNRGAGNVYLINYTDENNQKHTIEKKETKTVKSFRVGGYVNDYIPLKASKPKKYQRHIELKVDGKIKIYDHIRLVVSTSEETGERQFYSVVGAGAKIYTIKLDNGMYYEINNKNLNKYIIPYMTECQEFTFSYKGKVTVERIEIAVKKYNELCGEE